MSHLRICSLGYVYDYRMSKVIYSRAHMKLFIFFHLLPKHFKFELLSTIMISLQGWSCMGVKLCWFPSIFSLAKFWCYVTLSNIQIDFMTDRCPDCLSIISSGIPGGLLFQWYIDCDLWNLQLCLLQLSLFLPCLRVIFLSMTYLRTKPSILVVLGKGFR